MVSVINSHHALSKTTESVTGYRLNNEIVFPTTGNRGVTSPADAVVPTRNRRAPSLVAGAYIPVAPAAVRGRTVGGPGVDGADEQVIREYTVN